MNRIISTLGFLIICISCKTIKTNVKPELSNIDDSKNLYAFIGKKIFVTEFDPNQNNERKVIDSITGNTIIHKSHVMDNGFKCKYIVKSNLYNQIKKDTIEFKAYDHYGRPGFESYDEVIIYLSKDKEGNFYHRKYQFDAIYLDSKRKYYSFPKFLGDGYLEEANNLKSFRVSFPETERFDISKIGESVLKRYYPNYYYRVEKQYAYPIRGMFLEQLIEFRLKTTFKDL